MKVQNSIEEKLSKACQPAHLEVINESGMHNVPPGSESHFKLIVVSENFAGKMLIARHREINKILEDELANGVHALSIHALTPEEWEKKNGSVAASPKCHGGSSNR